MLHNSNIIYIEGVKIRYFFFERSHQDLYPIFWESDADPGVFLGGWIRIYGQSQPGSITPRETPGQERLKPNFKSKIQGCGTGWILTGSGFDNRDYLTNKLSLSVVCHEVIMLFLK